MQRYFNESGTNSPFSLLPVHVTPALQAYGPTLCLYILTHSSFFRKERSRLVQRVPGLRLKCSDLMMRTLQRL